MKALVFHNIGDIRYEPDWPEPRPPGEGEVKIAASWCGICGTDLEDYERGGVIPLDAPHPLSGRKAPLVLGHEYSGRVAELGPGVNGLKDGQRVAVECVKTCKQCYWCRRHQHALCANMVSVGQQDDGGMAESFIIPAENCIPIPDDLGEDAAAVAEPIAVMVRAVRKARLQAGETVAVVGAGPIGLAGVAMAKIAGASQVIAVAHGGRRAEVAALMGATYVLDSREPGWREAYADITKGMNAHVVFDTGGNVKAMQLALELTGRAGRCVFVSVADADIPLPGLDIMLNEKEIIGSVAHTYDEEFLWAVQYLADGRIDAAPLITSRIHLSDAVENGFKKLQKDRNEIKILVTPHEDWVAGDRNP
ncbi:MAG: alcohol dehydrogenase catalytic domain-containing protein [Kiritimatiellae bacterium]|nr:alcohol dehydrogenase catalytic domain-containing protein [Kiritimatiellia bacterium]